MDHSTGRNDMRAERQVYSETQSNPIGRFGWAIDPTQP